jgi:hypothetical protein
MSNAAALEVLERRLADMERKANALVETINDLRAEDGLVPRPPFGGGGPGGGLTAAGGAAIATQIKSDTFYGKKMQTAVREYLEMRKAATGGATNPASPREIYEAITTGGFQFETKDETNALVGLRQLLRKRTAFFHKLPNGTYGLTSWYPDAKKPKATADDDDADTDEATETKEAATTKKVAAAS